MLKVANSVISASRITGTLPVANGGTGVTTSTGTGNTVLSASPTLSGDVNFSTGNVVIGTSGKGIDFSVTGEGTGTMTSELLADYEEGTWTPGIGTLTQVGGSFSSAGTYTKVGRQVTVVCRIDISGGTISGTAFSRLSGLPFTVVAPTSIGTGINSAYTATFSCAPEATETNAYVTSFAATSGIKFTCTYFV